MKKIIFSLFSLITFILTAYGLGRLYFHLTDGFTLSNITSSYSFQPQWEVRPLQLQEEQEVKHAIHQPYHYLGKGCQSYVFASEDGNYVMKFFKYQRSRIPPWLAYFPPLPAIVRYREEKAAKKWKQLDRFVQSWKLVFEHLKEEAGLVFVHLNKTSSLNHELTLYDKLGFKHVLDLDQMEFCIQRRAQMLDETLLTYKSQGELDKAKSLTHQLLNLIVSEYARGIADKDHALLQNTGVSQGHPVHIDVGQFVFQDDVKHPQVFHQELYTKTFRFKQWLQEHYVELADYLEEELYQIIGPAYQGMTPQFTEREKR